VRSSPARWKSFDASFNERIISCVFFSFYLFFAFSVKNCHELTYNADMELQPTPVRVVGICAHQSPLSLHHFHLSDFFSSIRFLHYSGYQHVSDKAQITTLAFGQVQGVLLQDGGGAIDTFYLTGTQILFSLVFRI